MNRQYPFLPQRNVNGGSVNWEINEPGVCKIEVFLLAG